MTRKYRDGDCDVCAEPDCKVTTLHELGTLQVCNPCLVDTQDAIAAASCGSDQDDYAGELPDPFAMDDEFGIPQPVDALGLTLTGKADLVFSRR